MHKPQNQYEKPENISPPEITNPIVMVPNENLEESQDMGVKRKIVKMFKEVKKFSKCASKHSH